MTWSSRSRSCGPVRSRATWCIPICGAATAKSRSNYPSRGAAKTCWEDARRAAVPGTGDEDRRSSRRDSPPAEAERPAPRHGDLPPQRHDATIQGQVHRRHDRRTATSRISPQRCFKQIEGFGDYGFPESHAASFALLVYASAWIKCHLSRGLRLPRCSTASRWVSTRRRRLVRDAREHGVEVRPVDVNLSEWDCTLEHFK